MADPIPIRNGALWFAALGSPIAWAVHLVVIYPLVPVACRAGGTLSIWIVSFACAAIAVASGAVAFRHRNHRGGAEEERARFMARAGLAASVLFLAIIVAETVPVLFASPCALVGALGVRSAHAGPIGPARTVGDVLAGWTPDPLVVAALAIGSIVYACGALRVRRRSARGAALRGSRVLAFAGAISALALALASPLDALADVIFCAHMVQHLLLVLVAAPLLAIARTRVALAWSLPRPARLAAARAWAGAGRARAVVRALQTAGVVLALHVGGLWAWHHPALYAAALRDPAVHALEHLCFLVPAALLAGKVIAWAGPRAREAGVGIAVLFLSALQGGVLGALLTLAPRPWYGVHVGGVGLDPLEDQQIAGLLMWIPAGVVYLSAALVLASSWLRASEARVAPAVAVPLLLAIGAGGAGCRARTDAAPVVVAGDRDVVELVGAQGSLRFSLRFSPRPKVAELFAVETEVRDAKTGAPIDAASFALDATMPAHGHGMTTAPVHRAIGPGRYRTEGMKLHMPGAWTFVARAEGLGRSDVATFTWNQSPWHR